MTPPASVRIEGLRQLRKDLRTAGVEVPRVLNREMLQAAQPFLRRAVATAPRSDRAERRARRATKAGRPARAGYKHLADTLRLRSRGSAVQLYSRKPGANVVRFGGRHPLFGDRDHWYAQAPNPWIERAAASTAPQIERELERAVNRALSRAGFH